jgi:hypothetical protein
MEMDTNVLRHILDAIADSRNRGLLFMQRKRTKRVDYNEWQ